MSLTCGNVNFLSGLKKVTTANGVFWSSVME
jgi:hypothetical protein